MAGSTLLLVCSSLSRPSRLPPPPRSRKFSTARKPAILRFLLGPCCNVVSVRKVRSQRVSTGGESAALLLRTRPHLRCRLRACAGPEHQAERRVPPLPQPIWSVGWQGCRRKAVGI